MNLSQKQLSGNLWLTEQGSNKGDSWIANRLIHVPHRTAQQIWNTFHDEWPQRKGYSLTTIAHLTSHQRAKKRLVKNPFGSRRRASKVCGVHEPNINLTQWENTKQWSITSCLKLIRAGTWQRVTFIIVVSWSFGMSHQQSRKSWLSLHGNWKSHFNWSFL